jgi:hypothetical protein
MNPFPSSISRRSFAARRLLAVGTVALAAASFATSASAAGLLEPLSQAESSSVTATRTAQTVRQQLVRIDYGYMESNLAPRGIDNAKGRLQQAPDATTVRLDLFPGVSLTLDRDSLKKASGGGYIWTGSVRGGDGGYAILVISKGQVTGQIQTGGKLYRVAPVEGEIHSVNEIDQGAFPGDIVVPAPAMPDNGANEASETNPEATKKTKIKILFPFTKAAKQQSGNIGNDINLAVELINTAAKNGGAKIKYKLAGKLKVKGYSEGSFESDLSAVTGGKGKFRKTRKKRNRTKADLVALLRSSGTYCGLGWYIANPSASTADSGFTVTAVTCITNHSVSHEVGHNSGLRHDRYQLVTNEGDPEPPTSEFNFGITNLNADIRSVMAYNSECADKQMDGYCPRVPMFSSAKKKYEGDKLGIRKGKPGAADARRRLNQTRAGVASYR